MRENEDDRDAPIVVGVDGGGPSRAALRWAVAESARGHSGVRAVLAVAGHEGVADYCLPHARCPVVVLPAGQGGAC